MKKTIHFIQKIIKHHFFIPLYVLGTIISAALIYLSKQTSYVDALLLLSGIGLGSWQLVQDTIRALRAKNFALDYIALLAIITGLLTGNFFVASVITLMMAGGNTLETYAQEKAKQSLTTLTNRIPHSVILVTENTQKTVPIAKVAVGSTLLVRKGEVIPLDGVLLSKQALIDESSVTGEAYQSEKQAGSTLQSGTVNVGELLLLQTTTTSTNSSYRHIIHLVEQAQAEKTPFLQLADRLSGWFTITALVLAGIAYALSGDVDRILAVLVIATPCPLILATPIALIGGMNTATRNRIIFKRLSALEILSKVRVMIFDKTGTLTFGIPRLSAITLTDTSFTKDQVLSLAGGLERGSLHPFARTLVQAAQTAKLPLHTFKTIKETLGKGITGNDGKHTYSISTHEDAGTIVLAKNKKPIAHFAFLDVLKPESSQMLQTLEKEGIELALFTGDSAKRTKQVLPNLPQTITIKTDLKPTDKQRGIQDYKKQGKLVAMVGDGINDAPALAQADVGIVFSHEEHTAASQAADVILLGGNLDDMMQAKRIAQRTLTIAQQSIFVGLGLSLLGMSLAVFGKLSPIWGALMQEGIDVAVIFNALRAALPQRKIG